MLYTSVLDEVFLLIKGKIVMALRINQKMRFFAVLLLTVLFCSQVWTAEIAKIVQYSIVELSVVRASCLCSCRRQDADGTRGRDARDTQSNRLLGMFENKRNWQSKCIGSTGRLDCIFHPGTSFFLWTFFAAVLGRYQRQNDKGIYDEYGEQNQQRQ